ncbi:MAG: hypothetical protein ACTSP9_03215 [Promethearchaeota archaeon]
MKEAFFFFFMTPKPNIIFILNDHQAFYGHGEMVGGPKIINLLF